MKKTFKFKLVTLKGTEINNDEIEFLKVRTKTGDVGILANHTDYVSVVGSGKMEVVYNSNKKLYYYISGGFLEVKEGNVFLLAEDLIDYANKDQILEERQKQIKASIKEKLKEDKDVLGTKKKIQDSLRR